MTQIIKVLNPHIPSKKELLFVMFVRDFYLKFKDLFRKNILRNRAVVRYLSILDVIKKDNIVSIRYFLCQYTELFLSKNNFDFIGTSFAVLFYLEYMKKIKPPRPEACYCNIDDIRTRSNSEI